MVVKKKDVIEYSKNISLSVDTHGTDGNVRVDSDFIFKKSTHIRIVLEETE